MEYIVIAQPAANAANKFENHRILRIDVNQPIPPQIPAGFALRIGAASLDDCVKYIKEISGGQPNWFGLTVFQYILIAVVTLTFVGVIGLGAVKLYNFNSDPNLKLITTADDAARILITFLVAVSTVAIAFLAILTAMVIREYKERFALAKEVLTLLVGILGTIVGFYFGTASKTGPDNGARPAATASPTPANMTKLNPTVRFGAVASGKDIERADWSATKGNPFVSATADTMMKLGTASAQARA